MLPARRTFRRAGGYVHDPGAHFSFCHASFGGTFDMAYSLRAVMVSEGFTPRLQGTTDPSRM